MYTLKKDTEITKQVILDAIKYNDGLKPRFDKLEAYYFGKQEILNRERTDQLVNNKIVVNHAKYITDTNVGYLMGNAVEYQADEEVKDDTIKPVLDAYKKQVISDLDNEIAKDVSIYGMQYEYIFATEDNTPKSANVDNRRAMLIYDTTLEHNKLAGLMYRPIFEGNRTTPSYYEVVLATSKEIVEYKVATERSGTLTEVSRKPHGFGKVPMIEYRNNSDYIGDFEQVITLIDAYNLLQSDRVNDKEQLVDAILTFYGAEVKQVDMDMLREQRVISGIPADAKVEYLTKGLNEADADTLRQTIEQDIHKISMTPNMSDAEFVGNSSGVAIRYKLLPFEQNTKTKERFMERGLMERFELYYAYLKSVSKVSGDLDISHIDAVFKRNLPSNDLETSTIINNLDGKVSTETLIAQLSFIKDASEEMEAVKAEAEERQAKVADLFKNGEINDANDDDNGGKAGEDEDDDENLKGGKPTKNSNRPPFTSPKI